MEELQKLHVEVEKNGYVFIPKFAPKMLYDDAARQLGVFAKMNDGRHHTHLKPREKGDSQPSSYSGIYGLERFPFHTDLAHWRGPPRYLILRCVTGFADVPTQLIDGQEIIKIVGNVNLQRALVRPRRPLNGKMPLLRLLQQFDGNQMLRWDEKFLLGASELGLEVMTLVRRAIDQIDQKNITLLDVGDTIIVDNWRMLHARAPIPESCRGRHIVRSYMEKLN